MEIELKISNGEYLTHEDLEKYLNKYEDFYKTKIDEGILEYEWKELVKEHNDIIEQTISNFEKIEIIVSDIKKLENYNIRTGPYSLLNNFYGSRLRGEELGLWRLDRNYKNIIYLIKGIDFKINNEINVPYKHSKFKKFVVPEVSFNKIVTEKPESFKKGSKLIVNINIVNRQRFGLDKKGEYINLDYIEKVDFFPPNEQNLKSKKQIKIDEIHSKNFKPESNSNCFVVTTTMGDTNHPVVNDFRNYRDEVLLETNLGRLFIKVYYKIGPYLSEIIKNNKTLFQISRSFILKLHKRISKR